jgi:hypothetical protein
MDGPVSIYTRNTETRSIKLTCYRHFGKISERLRLKSPETDFEKGIRHFGYMLMEITLVLVLIIFAINVLLHKLVLDLSNRGFYGSRPFFNRRGFPHPHSLPERWFIRSHTREMIFEASIPLLILPEHA